MKLRSLRGGSSARRLKKLTEAQALDIIRNCQAPEDDRRFMAKYDLCANHVADIRCGRAWKWLRKDNKEIRDMASSMSEAIHNDPMEALRKDHESLSEAVRGMLGDIRIMHQRLLLLERKVAALQEFKEAVAEEVAGG